MERREGQDKKKWKEKHDMDRCVVEKLERYRGAVMCMGVIWEMVEVATEEGKSIIWFYLVNQG